MKKHALFIIMASLLVLCLFPTVALADLGPKSSLDIVVTNAPAEPYYLDFLVTDDYGMDAEYKPDGYDEDMFKLLWDYNQDGYRAKMVHQSNPISGIRGQLSIDSDGVYHFAQVPSEFKIIIVTQSGDVRVSEVYHRHRFSDSITLNGENMDILVTGGGIVWDWVSQFLQTFGATIVIEGIILLLFGFRLRDNWKPFLVVNLITQVVLITSVGFIITFAGAFAYIISFILIEAAIVVAESLAYEKLLKRDKPGGRIAYAITANIISLAFTFFYVSISYWLA